MQTCRDAQIVAWLGCVGAARHTDGGELVRRLYGHRDHDRALDQVTIAYERIGSLTQMRLGRTLECHPRTGVGGADDASRQESS